MLSDADIHWMVQQIVEACRPSQIYVFGSYATGAADARSDLDLLIIQPSRLPRHRRGAGMRGRLARIAIDVDLVFVTPEELRDELTRASSMMSAILPSARLVFSTETSVADHFFGQRIGEARP
jgi:predicted nucleotidyltransferase